GYIIFTYWSWEETDGIVSWDIRKVFIFNDVGATGDLLHQLYNNDNFWYLNAVDLSGYVGDIVQIRFEFDTVDSGENQFLGWLIDDIAIDDSPLVTPTPVPIPATSKSGGLLLFGLMSLVLLFVLSARRLGHD
ncbi:hypothetical protein K8T06_01915, partial [bacterium]|nr:hypothetical protein [bacterium]